ncbi:MAG: FAD-dependent oxidoreductase, partial [Candidatus Methylomirabilales bacterium]
MDELRTDILIVGAGGAGLMAALHAADHGRRLSVTVIVKGLLGRAGCTRMVQGGYNVVLTPPDSLEDHFLDTLEGGAWISDQELAWTLVSRAPERIREMEARYGCFFDRTPAGRIHQKPFAGQSHDRTVHRGDLTGIEIMNRLTEQVLARPIQILEEHRAIGLLHTDAGGIGGALLMDMRTGEFKGVRAAATLLAAGGGPTMYQVVACSADKSADGLAMAYRSGASLQDMEMVQFHPTGLVAPGSLLTGALLEEGLRGAGGRLYNGQGERYMERYDPVRLERSTRDIVARASYIEIAEGRGTPAGGVLLDVSHLGTAFVEANFPGMVLRCRDFGWDLTKGPVEVQPTAHFTMGGVRITPDCHTGIEGLFAAGEDAGGVHGANRLGGNGVADSTVFGGIAGDVMAAWVIGRSEPRVSKEQGEMLAAEASRPVGGGGPESLYAIRDRMREIMWDHAGLIREEGGLRGVIGELGELQGRLERAGVQGGWAYNLAWMDWLNIRNQLLVAQMIAQSALLRRESRGSHYRRDHPKTDNPSWLVNVCLRQGRDGIVETWTEPVRLSRRAP